MRHMIHNLFPSSVYMAPVKSRSGLDGKLDEKFIAKLNRDLLKESHKISEIDVSGREWSEKNYPGGFTSYGSMSELHRFSTTFGDLEKLIDLHVHQFVKNLEMDIRPTELKMRNCWVNIMPKAVVHTMHMHPLSVISGTYYLRIPKGTSGLKFEDPRMGLFMASPPRKAKARAENQRFITMTPKPGHLILFESWMRHEVPPNPIDGQRVSLSFNYDWMP